jgi:hypothetical protein
MLQTTTQDGDNSNQLAMMRGALLRHLAASQLPPENLLPEKLSFSSVTHWEELICTAINPEAGCLMALVGIHRTAGYSGPLYSHGSIEYVRFFIDWEDGAGYRPESLTHFKVYDRLPDAVDIERPRYRRVSTSFDQERYLGSLMNGVRPKVKAVLSWHRVPDMDHEFTPLFGNAVESNLCIDSDKPLDELIRDYSQGELVLCKQWQGAPLQTRLQ